jgi:integrase
MGGSGQQGVEAREKSIRLTFTLDGKSQRHTLMIGGTPMPPTPANLKYAGRLAAEIRERIKHGTFSLAEYFPASGAGAGPVTVSTQLDTWLAGQRIEESSRAGYVSCAKFWRETIGEKPLRALKHSDILTALATRPDLSGKTVNNRMSVLREALAVAVLDGLIPDNPAANVKSAKHQKPPVDPFTAAEADAIIADMAKHYDPQVANYTACKFFTGLRTGESFGLKWANVDLASKHMAVQESIVRGIEKASTKTHVARTVFLNSRAMDAIRAQKAHTFMAGEHVFHDPRDNKHWTGEPKYRWFWLPTLKRLGIRHRPPYTTRHTYATMMLMAGLTPAFCAGQMGHSVDVFLRTYAKWIPGAGDATEMAKLESRIRSTGT